MKLKLYTSRPMMHALIAFALAAVIAMTCNHLSSNMIIGREAKRQRNLLAAGITSFEEGDYESAILSLSGIPTESKLYEDAAPLLDSSIEAYINAVIVSAKKHELRRGAADHSARTGLPSRIRVRRGTS